MKARYFHQIETLTLLPTTIIGVMQGQVTVFYIIYLFWFQELVRTIINRVNTIRSKSNNEAAAKDVYGSFFILLIYFVFIVVLFGFILNWGNLDLMAINIQTFLFRNWYFDITILLFAAQYFLYSKHTAITNAGIAGMNIFNRNHIILHLSIILGGLLQMMVVKRYPEYFSGDVLWGSALVVLPFLLLKVLIGREN